MNTLNNQKAKNLLKSSSSSNITTETEFDLIFLEDSNRKDIAIARKRISVICEGEVVKKFATLNFVWIENGKMEHRPLEGTTHDPEEYEFVAFESHRANSFSIRLDWKKWSGSGYFAAASVTLKTLQKGRCL